MMEDGIETRRTLLWRIVPLLAASLLFAVAAGACSSSSSSPPPPGSVTAVLADTGTPTAVAPSLAPEALPDAPEKRSAGCSARADAVPAAGAALQTITSGGVQRTYRRYLPAGASAVARPVVINIHGLTSNIDQQVAISAFEPLAGQAQFIVLTPQALGTPTQWDVSIHDGNADVAFIDAMLDQAEAATCVDTARVYSTGMSDGGIMSALLACVRADRIAAVGLVSGITHPDGCAPARPVPMMVFWGDKDVVLPFCGGLGPVVASLIANRPLANGIMHVCPPERFDGFPPVEDAVATWAATDGCGPSPTVLTVSAAVEQRVFGSCDGDASVRFYVVAGGGHTWPGSKLMEALSSSAAASIIGFTTDDIDATKLIWSFFRGYALR